MAAARVGDTGQTARQFDGNSPAQQGQQQQQQQMYQMMQMAGMLNPMANMIGGGTMNPMGQMPAMNPYGMGAMPGTMPGTMPPVGDSSDASDPATDEGSHCTSEHVNVQDPVFRSRFNGR